MSTGARVASSMTLVALPSAVSCARAFTASMLRHWCAAHLEDDAVLVVSELVTNAVTATRPLDSEPRWSDLASLNLVTVRLLALRESIVIEVRDVSPKSPVRVEQYDDAEGGRGLILVEALSSRWGYFPVARGKVVWSELSIKPTLD